MPYIAEEQGRVICACCGCKGDDHRHTDGKCPTTISWGRHWPFPSLANVHQSPVREQEITVDLARYWGDGDPSRKSFKARK